MDFLAKIFNDALVSGQYKNPNGDASNVVDGLMTIAKTIETLAKAVDRLAGTVERKVF